MNRVKIDLSDLKRIQIIVDELKSLDYPIRSIHIERDDGGGGIGYTVDLYVDTLVNDREVSIKYGIVTVDDW